jgi:hypothetical protein
MVKGDYNYGLLLEPVPGDLPQICQGAFGEVGGCFLLSNESEGMMPVQDGLQQVR